METEQDLEINKGPKKPPEAQLKKQELQEAQDKLSSWIKDRKDTIQIERKLQSL